MCPHKAHTMRSNMRSTNTSKENTLSASAPSSSHVRGQDGIMTCQTARVRDMSTSASCSRHVKKREFAAFMTSFP